MKSEEVTGAVGTWATTEAAESTPAQQVTAKELARKGQNFLEIFARIHLMDFVDGVDKQTAFLLSFP